MGAILDARGAILDARVNPITASMQAKRQEGSCLRLRRIRKGVDKPKAKDWTRSANLATLRSIIRLCVAIICLALSLPLQAASQADVNSSLTQVPAKAWADQAATRETEIILHSGSYIRYHQRSIDSRRDELRDVVESKDGPVARLLMRDNRPLAPEEDQAERDRLSGLIDHPSDFQKHVKNDANGKKQAVDLIRLMPAAMIYTYAADQTPASNSSAPQVVIDYAPDPKFNPPTIESQALAGLRGRIWIDTNAKTIVRMTADIFQSVNFGWGMLAHVFPGGKIDLEQTDAISGRWNMTSFHEHVTVKALMVKTINVNSEVHSFDFQQIPSSMSYQDAIHLLLNTPLPK